MDARKDARKFIFDSEIVILELNDETITLSVGIDVVTVLEEFYIDNSAVFEKAARLLSRLEEREFPLSSVREMIREFIERQAEKLALQSL